MTTPRPTDDRLYRLLPAIYRIRDVAQGEPLRALLAIAQQELQVVEADIDALYDNWFIETCAEWVVPYIGDLLDVGELYAGGSSTYGQQERRAYVANTLSYRRRKGTTPVLEQLTQDVTGWRSRAVEFGRLVNTSQTLSRLRPSSTTVNLRANERLEQIGTPFEQQAAYSVDVRSPFQGGRYNVPNVGLYVWRLQSYPLDRVEARAVEVAEDGQSYTFNPVGPEQVPLFNQPQTKTDIVTLAAEINVPAILRRPVLADELNQRRQLRSQGEPLPTGNRYFDTDPVLQIFINGQPQSLPPEVILIADLAKAEDSQNGEAEALDWKPATDILWDGDADHSVPPPAYRVAIDPERGRMIFRPGLKPTRVEVGYFYGFSDDLGGGPYSRIAALADDVEPSELPISPWHWLVQQAASADPNPLATAIEAWNRTVTVRYGLRVGTHIPLALVTVPPVQVVKQQESTNTSNSPPPFKPGVVRGLGVSRGLCPTELIVEAGLAIDGEGQPLRLSCARRIDVVSRFKEAIRTLPDLTGVLVLFYQPAVQGYPVELGLIPESTLVGYLVCTMIPLARIQFDSQAQFLAVEAMDAGSVFQAGIVQGFEVNTRPGTLETWISPGTVIDAQGNSLVLTDTYSVDLAPYQGSARRLVVVPSESGVRRIQLLTDEALTAFKAPYLLLAWLDIPVVSVGTIQTHPERIGRDLSITTTNLTLTSSGRTLQLTAGAMQWPTGETLMVGQPHALDLSPFAGRTLLLFLSAQADQGWPLTITATGSTEGNAYVGVIPVEPPTEADTTDPLRLAEVDTGWIVLRDSATYRGDVTLAIPPNTHLHWLAADGCRPHIQGCIAVQGWAAERQAQSELTLNGLLVDGGLQILPGSLGKLTLQHCTLVPQQGGLQVQVATEAGVDCEPEDFSLLVFLAYALAMIWQLIAQDLGINRRGPSLTMTQFLQTSWQQLMVGMAELFALNREPVAFAWGNIPLDQVENDRLEISLDRTICGPIVLAETVPSLRIANSVVDQGQDSNSSEVAIAAPGTTLDITATTVLGRTTVREIEASHCLFTEKVIVGRHQTGCIRFSYVPVASSTPRRYRCQPDLALSEALDTVPSAIRGLSVLTLGGLTNPAPPYAVFAATAEDGIFRLGQSAGQWGWTEVNGDLRDRTLTSLASYQWMQQEVLVGNMTGQIFRLANAPLLTENQANASFDWRPLPLANLNAAITRLHFDPHVGFGKVLPPVQSTESEERTVILGQGTRFSQELQQGDVICLDKIHYWQVEHLGRPSDTTLTAKGRQIRLQDLAKIADLQLGNTLTLARRLQPGASSQTISQTRTIVTLNRDSTPPTLTINAPFGPAFETDQPQLFVINIDTELIAQRVLPVLSEISPGPASTANNEQPDESSSANNPTAEGSVTSGDEGGPIEDAAQPLDDPSSTASPTPVIPEPIDFTILRLWATTDGGGLWRGSVDGQTWQPFNPGLTVPSLTAIARYNQQLWLGTAGGGVFRLDQGETAPRWQPVNQGLTQGYITALQVTGKNQVTGENSLLAATRNGIFSFDPERNEWDDTSTGLTSLDITTLAAQPKSLTELTDQPESPTELATQPASPMVLAGSREGRLFVSIDSGLNWYPLGLDLRGTNITAMEVDEASGDIWVGTAAGAVLRSPVNSLVWQAIQQGQSPANILVWQSVQQGRSPLATKLQILSQLQPSFTSIRYGEPGYMQLRQNCPEAIRAGGEDGAEMGVFYALKQPQREANLLASLDEYLRFGLAAGIFYMT